jgi:hypothetical protein
MQIGGRFVGIDGGGEDRALVPLENLKPRSDVGGM